jgi:hypothetical protein
VSGLVKRLALVRCESAEGVLAASTVVGGLDPDDDRQPELFAVRQRRRFRTFFCSRLKNDSMAALSAHAPTRPIEPSSSTSCG